MFQLRRNFGRAGLIGVVGLAAVLVFASPASAHNYYVSSTPGQNEVLTSLPDQFSVTTSDNLLDLDGKSAGFLLEIKGPDGLYYGDGCVTISGPTISMDAAIGPAGDYTMDWQVISADGHTTSGSVPFVWQPSSETTASKGSATPPTCNGAAAPTSGETASDSGAVAIWIGAGIVAVVIVLLLVAFFLNRKPESQVEESEPKTPETPNKN